MATWPAGLPAPQKKISITPGDTRTERKLQSGRTEFRRFGDGKPDQVKVLFRLLWVQWETFKTFYEYDLNLGLNWFSASWLATLGYSEHKAKILGYPREVARQGYYVDIVCTLMVQKTAWIIGEDTLWPCAVTGGESPPPSEIAAYACGGIDSHLAAGSVLLDCDEYDPYVWTSKTNMPLPKRYSFTASTISSMVYVYGGYDDTLHYLQDCDRYTPDTWTSKSDMILPARRYFAASTIGGSGYVYGGRAGDLTYLQDCDKYSPDVWTSKSDMPSPTRLFLAASTIGGSGYIYGGYDPYVYLQDCDQYTPDTWVSKSSMPSPARYGLAASTIGSSGYIFGGYNGAEGILQDCDEYTPDTWVSKSNMPLPIRKFLAASTINDYAYIFGGQATADSIVQDCDEYTPDTWISRADMPLPERRSLAASTI